MDADTLGRDFVVTCVRMFAGDAREFDRIWPRIAKDGRYYLLYLAHLLVAAAALHCKDDKLTIEGTEQVLEEWVAVEAALSEHLEQWEGR